MMALIVRRLVTRLPATRGSLMESGALAPFTWFRVGGPAEVLFKPEDDSDLMAFLNDTLADVPVMVIGVGSNLLVRDGGVEGVVIRLGRAFGGVTVEGNRIRAGAAALDVHVAAAARAAGLTGLEFLRGIPGTIGGALRMNAGAYGAEMKDVLVEATAVTREGRKLVLSAEDMGFSYRHSAAPEGLVFIEAVLQGQPGDQAEIDAKMAEITKSREETQPVRSRTGGSTFKNPAGRKAWELIDAAGCRGLVRGGAQVSEKHCNFLINLGNATAADIEGLGEEVRRRVFESQGVRLEWEIKRIGKERR